jgi:hypothetical protein
MGEEGPTTIYNADDEIQRILHGKQVVPAGN